MALWLKSVGLVMLVLGLSAAAPKGEAVHFKQLISFLDVKIPGYQMDDKPTGTTLKQEGMQFSEARAAFHAGDKRLEIIIMDFLGQTMPFLAGMPRVEMETNAERIKTTQVQGFKALETFRPQDKEGELSISVADRFWVKIDGDNIDSPEILHTAATAMNLKKLAELAK